MGHCTKLYIMNVLDIMTTILSLLYRDLTIKYLKYSVEIPCNAWKFLCL